MFYHALESVKCKVLVEEDELEDFRRSNALPIFAVSKADVDFELPRYLEYSSGLPTKAS